MKGMGWEVERLQRDGWMGGGMLMKMGRRKSGRREEYTVDAGDLKQLMVSFATKGVQPVRTIR